MAFTPDYVPMSGAVTTTSKNATVPVINWDHLVEIDTVTSPDGRSLTTTYAIDNDPTEAQTQILVTITKSRGGLRYSARCTSRVRYTDDTLVPYRTIVRPFEWGVFVNTDGAGIDLGLTTAILSAIFGVFIGPTFDGPTGAPSTVSLQRLQMGISKLKA